MILFANIKFIIIQSVVLISIIIFSFKKDKQNYFLLSSESNFYILMVASMLLAYLYNSDYQLFCTPVLWTKVVLLIYSIYFAGNKIFKQFIGEFANQFILGLGIIISIYSIIFGSFEYLIWVGINLIVIVPVYFLSRYLNKKFNTCIFDFINLYAATILLPYVIAGWTIRQIWNKQKAYKISLIMSPIIVVIIAGFLTIRISNIIQIIDSKENTVLLTKVIHNKTDKYLTELILGAHWKYHTRICVYDGWRPPFHDPVLGFAQSILYFRDHFNSKLNLTERKLLYKQIFPNNKTSFDCKCAKAQLH